MLIAITPASADDAGEDTRRFYLSKSSLVVSGEIVGLLPSMSSGLGVVGYGIGLKVAKVLKGELPKERPKAFLPSKKPEDKDVFWVSLAQADTRPLPFVKKGQPVILFLREGISEDKKKVWQEADPWFAVQRGNLIMEELLERVVKEDAKED